MFWFRVGLFTLMYMDSLMVLACLQTSLPMMLKLLFSMECPVVLGMSVYGGRLF